MTQKLRRLLFAFLTAAVLALVPATSAHAMTPVFGHRYQNGVGNVVAWINYSSGAGNWQWYITNATNNWMYPGWSNPIYVNYVSSNVGSNLDFHSNNDAYFGGGMTIIAWTTFFSSTGAPLDPTLSDWYYAEVHINNDVYSSPSISNDMALGTTIHEVGHALGLAHYNSNPYSIMCQTSYGRVVQRVQQVDNDSILYLY
ncbi:matrixin family metalloprotease [Sinomonas sp. ASV322]|uniref:matrixin family metalloprotease n=1 Tax=Sinomonas sp. ASV322 TaxID=3041920 RepID=UPI0027DCFEF9|nr:matrixin family metalloprotease [Sinomonas sp. ASV322]MDQ4503166.1 matrixin family metalloprotease [Sinomonas sp. ASV322]